MKYIILLVALSFSLNQNINGQKYTPPQIREIKSPEEFIKLEPEVLKGIDYLLNSPVDKDQDNRKATATFLMLWMSESPDVSIVLDQTIAPFLECGDCLIAFMTGWTKYAIENKYPKDKLKGALAGIENTVALYLKNRKSLGKIKSIENFRKMKAAGKLENYIAQHLRSLE